MSRLIILLIILFTDLFTFAHQECRRFIQPNSCNYYLCEEMNHSFGVRGYFIGFGYKFCSNYIKAPINYYQPQTEKWLRSVANCLQTKLMTSHNKKDSDQQVWTKAVKTHAQCYYETGACQLPKTELLKVINQFKYELRYPTIFVEGLKFVAYCAKMNPNY